jgi:transcriptional regulator with XRE-family HTH domain/quercetin dioxygenase-like cupin family protein
VPPLGSRIRAERTRKGMTVRGLARDIGVSPSLISQIETDKSQPSVSTLYAITTALDITIEELFDQSENASSERVEVEADPVVSLDADVAVSPVVSSTAALQLATAAFAGVSAQPSGRPQPVDRPGHGHVQPVVRPHERDLLTLDSGVTWERLGQVPNAHVDFLLITYRPGSTSSSTGALMRHPGTEYGYLLKGSLILTLGFDEYRLNPGDAVSFDSTTPHGYRNDGLEPAVGVWFVLERVT